MKQICFATNNPGKLREIQQLLQGRFKVLGLKDIGCHEDIPETRDTIEGNSLQKAEYIWQHYHVDCFADDTGLEVRALNNEPGVYSARYAGLQRSSADNMRLLLQKLRPHTDRAARFKTVITLMLNGQAEFFEGIAEGTIATQQAGVGGFGYDPVFIPAGHTKSFAEMSADEKNLISHRGKAVRKLVKRLAAKQ